MGRKRRKREWPGDPHGVWAEAKRSHGAGTLPRPEIPDWRDADVFTDRVLLPPSTPSPLGMAAAGVFLAVLAVVAWWKDRSGVLVVGLTAGAVILVVTGCFLMWWLPARRAHRVRRVHARALQCGVGAHAYRTTFSRSDGEGGRTPTSLLIDGCLPNFEASRLQRAVRDWLRRVTTDGHLAAQANQRLAHRWVVPTAEIFGPDAIGGWLALDQGDDDTPWRLLIDRPDGPEEYYYDEVMVINGSPGRLYLD